MTDLRDRVLLGLVRGAPAETPIEDLRRLVPEMSKLVQSLVDEEYAELMEQVWGPGPEATLNRLCRAIGFGGNGKEVVDHIIERLGDKKDD